MLKEGPLKLRAWHDPLQLSRLASQWCSLWTRCRSATVFQRPEWLLAWVDVFRPRNLRVIEIRNGERLVGLAPLLVYTRDNQRILALMGGGVSDYLDVLIDPEFEAQAVGALWNFLHDDCSDWDLLELTDLPEASVLLRFHDMHSSVEMHPHDVCPMLRLPARKEDLGIVIPFRKRANLRNARNRTLREGGCRIESANEQTVSRMLDDMFRLHTSRWHGRGDSGILDDPLIPRFHRGAVPQLVARDLVKLQALFLNDRMIAALYNFVEANSVSLYLQAFDPQFAPLSPGSQIIGVTIEDAIAAGKEYVNFLRGREPYKYAWGAKDTTTFLISARRVASSSHSLGRQVA